MNSKKQIVKNQHYIPQGLLKNFSNEQGYLCVYDKKADKIMCNRSSKSYCVEKNSYFYDGIHFAKIDDETFIKLTDEQPLEKAYSNMENKVIPLIKKIEENPLLFYEKETFCRMIDFLYTLSIRTKNKRQEIDFLSKCDEDIYDKLNIENNSKTTVKDMHNMHQLDLTIEKKAVITILNNYNIYIAVNKTNESFIISDDPALNLRMRFNDICIPLTPKLAVVFRNKEGKLIVNDLFIDKNIAYPNVSDIIKYNLLQLNSGDYIFASKDKIQYYQILNKLLLIK